MRSTESSWICSNWRNSVCKDQKLDSQKPTPIRERLREIWNGRKSAFREFFNFTFRVIVLATVFKVHFLNCSRCKNRADINFQINEDKGVSKAPKGIQASSCAVPIARVLVFLCGSQKFPNSAICCRRRLLADAPPFSTFFPCMYVEALPAARLTAAQRSTAAFTADGYDVMSL